MVSANYSIFSTPPWYNFAANRSSLHVVVTVVNRWARLCEAASYRRRVCADGAFTAARCWSIKYDGCDINTSVLKWMACKSLALLDGLLV